jgi:hypothetical protein
MTEEALVERRGWIVQERTAATVLYGCRRITCAEEDGADGARLFLRVSAGL